MSSHKTKRTKGKGSVKRQKGKEMARPDGIRFPEMLNWKTQHLSEETPDLTRGSSRTLWLKWPYVATGSWWNSVRDRVVVSLRRCERPRDGHGVECSGSAHWIKMFVYPWELAWILWEELQVTTGDREDVLPHFLVTSSHLLLERAAPGWITSFLNVFLLFHVFNEVLQLIRKKEVTLYLHNVLCHKDWTLILFSSIRAQREPHYWASCIYKQNAFLRGAAVELFARAPILQWQAGDEGWPWLKSAVRVTIIISLLPKCRKSGRLRHFIKIVSEQLQS